MQSLYFYLSLISTLFLHSNEETRQEYLDLLESYPNITRPCGNASNGEIEIILEKEKMALIEKNAGRDVGVISKDNYWIWINDPCLFPSGAQGVYGRILPIQMLKSPSVGVAVMPIMPNGTIALNCIFRHATRSWEIEIPRGGINIGEEVEIAARREVMEETGMLLEDLLFLGEMPPDSGLTSTIAPIFAAKVCQRLEPQREEAEAIEKVITLSLDEIKEAFSRGYYECEIQSTKMKVPFRDPFLAYAILMYEFKYLKKDL